MTSIKCAPSRGNHFSSWEAEPSDSTAYSWGILPVSSPEYCQVLSFEPSDSVLHYLQTSGGIEMLSFLSMVLGIFFVQSSVSIFTLSFSVSSYFGGEIGRAHV